LSKKGIFVLVQNLLRIESFELERVLIFLPMWLGLTQSGNLALINFAAFLAKHKDANVPGN
jgi:hypothetical protein